MFRAFSASAASRPGKRARLTQPEALWLNYQWVTEYGEKIGTRWVISVKNVKGFILPFCPAALMDCGAGVTVRPDGVMVGVVTLLFALVLASCAWHPRSLVAIFVCW